jgi:sulfur relay (sulfurtransferase) DsrF/TusC family protein
MSLSVTVVIREDPRKSHRAAEALRIALGLSTGGNPLTVVLLGNAPLLLTDEPEDLVDGEILIKHLPVLKELEIPFLIPDGAVTPDSLASGFLTRLASREEIATHIAHSDRVLVF